MVNSAGDLTDVFGKYHHALSTAQRQKQRHTDPEVVAQFFEDLTTNVILFSFLLLPAIEHSCSAPFNCCLHNKMLAMKVEQSVF